MRFLHENLYLILFLLIWLVPAIFKMLQKAAEKQQQTQGKRPPRRPPQARLPGPHAPPPAHPAPHPLQELFPEIFGPPAQSPPPPEDGKVWDIPVEPEAVGPPLEESPQVTASPPRHKDWEDGPQAERSRPAGRRISRADRDPTLIPRVRGLQALHENTRGGLAEAFVLAILLAPPPALTGGILEGEALGPRF